MSLHVSLILPAAGRGFNRAGANAYSETMTFGRLSVKSGCWLA